MTDVISTILNPDQLLEQLGPIAFWVVLFIIFAECGLLFGFFFPGDSLLFLVGLLIAEGWIAVPLWVAVPMLTFVAIAGNVAGYWIGAKAGPRLFSADSKFFKQEYVDRTNAFFERHGKRAIIIARFVPIVRTFITSVAGVAGMNFRTFLTYSAIGGVIWAAGVTTAGYFLGTIPIIKNNIETFLLLTVVVSALPMVGDVIRHRRDKK